MAVTDECGRKVDAADVTINENAMSVSLIAAPSGTYTVTYSAAGSDEDSQSTPGSFTFRVHLGPACDGSTGDDHDGLGGHDGDEGGTKNDHVADSRSHSSPQRRPGHKHRGRDTEPPVQEDAAGPSGGGPGTAAPGAPAAANASEATGTDLVIALGLAMGLGAFGGVLLRFNPFD